MPAHPRSLLLATLLCLAATVTRAGTVRTVGQPVDWLALQDVHVSGPHHASLAEALAAADEGDTLLLLPGMHVGSHRIDKRLTLMGVAGTSGVAGGHQPTLQVSLTIAADGVRLERLAFELVGDPAVSVEGATDVVVRNCLFERMPGGIVLRRADRALLRDNHFRRVTRPLQLLGGRGLHLQENLIDGAGVTAIDADGTSDLLVHDNTLVDLGWAGLVLHGGSGAARITGNRFSGGDMGLVLQGTGHHVEANQFRGMARGVLLGSSPLTKDKQHHPHMALFDGTVVQPAEVTSGVTLRANSFVACRREAVLLRGAPGNRLVGNHFGAAPGHGVVLMSGSDDTELVENRFDERGGEHVLVVASAGSRLSANVQLGSPSTALAAVLVDAPVEGHVGDAPARVRGPAGERQPRPAPDGSGRLLVFGDFHTHSVLSDGSCSPEDNLRYGRDVAGLDFVALSDHGEILSLEAGRWPTIQRVAAAFAVPDRFATLAGYEVTFPATWAGHWNVYFPHDRGRLHRAPYDDHTGLCDTSSFSPRRLVDALVAEAEEFVIIRHHFWQAEDYWREAPDEPYHVPAAELCSVHGVVSGERDTSRNRNQPMDRNQDHLGSVAGGLAAGRVMGLVGSSDTHYGFPGDDGLAALYVEALTPGAIVDALRARASYATTGAAIVLAFAVDGTGMGGVIEPAARHDLSVVVEGTAALDEVVFFREDEVLLRARPAWSADGVVTWRDQDGRVLDDAVSPGTPGPDGPRTLRLTLGDERPAAPGCYWRARVRQRDGELAWSTPVWVTPDSPPALADAEVLLDKERFSLMLYAASLRAWPKLALGALGGLTPRQAMDTPTGRAALQTLWPQLVQNAERLNAQARELGLTSRAVAQRALDRFHHRWGHALPRTVLATEPLVDLDKLAEQLGIER